MENFGYTLQEMAETPATTFQLLLDEMKKKADREKEAMSKNKTLRN